MDKDEDGDVDAKDLTALRQKKESINNLTNEFATLQESINTLGNENKKLKTSNVTIIGENKKLKDTLRSLNEVFEDLVLQNAQLVYTNKVLEVSSLNERQKEKIVGAIRESKSAEQAKVVFETLQDAVSSNGSKSPRSLNEVFSKNSTKMISRKETNNETLPVATRWKTLAGIK
jgi:succinate dehydrogenase/fumarate reductase flavoprotein subunit